ncbi:MAG: radical SAM protein [Candidatus Azobacteroides sp.]|nr:radical SAM protein [Candidatus Azobacteroides sp.]
MATILFNEIVFGPVKSRRLGVSLGINLLPTDGKICSFDCIYCECGLNAQGRNAGKLPSGEEVKNALEEKLLKMKERGEKPDVITFAGNGEPTLHPEFASIIDDTLVLRDRFFPDTKVSVLSNSTMIRKQEVFEALCKVDYNILKLDSTDKNFVTLVDRPQQKSFDISSLIRDLKRFQGKLIIQTMFLKGEYEGQKIDNTTPEEIQGLIAALKEIQPQSVMIYSIDRETPVKGLKKVPKEELDRIANKFVEAGLSVEVSA